MHTVFALLYFVVFIHWLIVPYPPGLLHWHCGNLTIAPVPAKQPWWIWINTSCEFILNDSITTTKQSTTKPCAYFLGYTVGVSCEIALMWISLDLIDNRSKLVRVMAWCRQAITWPNVEPDSCRFMASQGHDDLWLQWSHHPCETTGRYITQAKLYKMNRANQQK